MKIGFDLDKIFIDTPPFIPDQLINKLYKKRDNGILLYRIPGPIEQLLRKLTHLPIFRPLIKDNINFLNQISKKNNQLYLISSRYKFLKNETNQIVKKNNLDKIFNGLYFNFKNQQPHLFKNEILKKLKLDIYIDDDLSLLKYVALNNPKTKFYWLSNKKNIQLLPKNIRAIKKIEEAFK